MKKLLKILFSISLALPIIIDIYKIYKINQVEKIFLDLDSDMEKLRNILDGVKERCHNGRN